MFGDELKKKVQKAVKNKDGQAIKDIVAKNKKEIEVRSSSKYGYFEKKKEIVDDQDILMLFLKCKDKAEEANDYSDEIVDTVEFLVANGVKVMKEAHSLSNVFHEVASINEPNAHKILGILLQQKFDNMMLIRKSNTGFFRNIRKDNKEQKTYIDSDQSASMIAASINNKKALKMLLEAKLKTEYAPHLFSNMWNYQIDTAICRLSESGKGEVINLILDCLIRSSEDNKTRGYNVDQFIKSLEESKSAFNSLQKNLRSLQKHLEDGNKSIWPLLKIFPEIERKYGKADDIMYLVKNIQDLNSHGRDIESTRSSFFENYLSIASGLTGFVVNKPKEKDDDRGYEIIKGSPEMVEEYLTNRTKKLIKYCERKINQCTKAIDMIRREELKLLESDNNNVDMKRANQIRTDMMRDLTNGLPPEVAEEINRLHAATLATRISTSPVNDLDEKNLAKHEPIEKK